MYLTFYKDDAPFLKEKYPELYTLLWPNGIPENTVYGEYGAFKRPLKDEAELRYIELEFADEIAGSLTPDGHELSKDGLEIERIWDYT